MSLTVGVDLVEIARIERVLSRHPKRFLNRIYTVQEQAHCRDRLRELAARFAAKEAVAKALGTGFRNMAWRDIEILADPLGRPIVQLHGQAHRRATDLGLTQIALSLSHERGMAIAMVVAS